MTKIRVKDLEVANVSSLVATDTFGVPFYAGVTPGIDGMWVSIANVIQFKTFANVIKNGISYDNTNKWIKLGGNLNESTVIDGLSTYGLNLNNLTTFNLTASSITLDGPITATNLIGTGIRDVVVDATGLMSTQPVLSVTMTGTSGAASYNPTTKVLNIPNYSSGAGISGLTTNYVVKATSSTTIGNSSIFDNGTNVMIGTTSSGPTFKLFVENTGTNTAIGATAQNGYAGYFESANTSTQTTLYVVRSNTSADIAEFHSALTSVRITASGSIHAGGLTGSDTQMVVVDTTGLMSTKSLYAYDTSSAGTFSPTVLRPSTFYGSTATWTLPTPDITTNGRTVTCENMGSGTLTINSASGTQIWETSALSSTTISPGTSVDFVCRNIGGTYYWFRK